MNTYLVTMSGADRALVYADDVDHAIEQAQDLYEDQVAVEVFFCTSVWENDDL